MTEDTAELVEEEVLIPVIITYDPNKPGSRDGILRWCNINLKFDGWSSQHGEYASRPAPEKKGTE